jgi:hypothetical protein
MIKNRLGEDTYQLYYLIDPRTNEVRYVGIAKNINARFKSHCSDFRRNTKKTAWIKKLKNLNLKPILQIVKSNLSKKEAEDLEIKEISNKTGLLNSSSGGLVNCGFTLSAKTKALMSKQRKSQLNGFYGKKHMQHVKDAVSKAQSIPIVDSNGVEYSSMTEAAQKFGVSPFCIHRSVKQNRKIRNGIRFFRKEKI